LKIIFERSKEGKAGNNLAGQGSKRALLPMIIILETIENRKYGLRDPALPEKKSSGSGTGSTQPREYN
jgi:hypothetical protein